jgi:glutaredoxin
MGRKNVYLFKMDTCPHCTELHELLNKSGIKHKMINIDKHEKLFESVMNNTGFDHVPQILVNEWNGVEFINSKFVADFDTLDEAVEQIEFLLKDTIEETNGN